MQKLLAHPARKPQRRVEPLPALLAPLPERAKSTGPQEPAASACSRQEELEKRLRDDPKDDGAACELIALHGKNLDAKSAMEAFKRLHGCAKPSWKAYARIVQACAGCKDMQGADRALEDAADNYPHSHELFLTLMRAYAAGGCMEGAERAFWRSISDLPPDRHLLKSSMRLFIDNGDLKRARKMLNIALQCGLADECMCGIIIGAHAGNGAIRELPGLLARSHAKGLCTSTDCFVAMKAFRDASSKEGALWLLEFSKRTGLANIGTFEAAVGLFAEMGDGRSAAKACLDASSLGMATLAMAKLSSSALYAQGRFRDIYNLIDSMPENIRENPYLILKKAEAFRKNQMPELALEVIEDFMETGNGAESQRQLAKVIRAFTLKAMGRLCDAEKAFLEAIRDMPPDSYRFARALCGLVFTWERIGFPDDRSLIGMIACHLRSFKHDGQTNLAEDMRKALLVLERAG